MSNIEVIPSVCRQNACIIHRSVHHYLAVAIRQLPEFEQAVLAVESYPHSAVHILVREVETFAREYSVGEEFWDCAIAV
jgi:hypothetical protein